MLKRVKAKILSLLLSEKEQYFLSLRDNGYLYEIGWVNSFFQKESLDNHNNPLPWVTYSFIDFIEDRLNNEMEIFEYGSGNSTLYYAQKVKSVKTVEHDIKWFEKMKPRIPNNVSLIYKDLVYGGDYCKTIKEDNTYYDIVIIDGRDRVNCIFNSVNYLKNNGVIILDDSERIQYSDGVEFLLSNSFKRIDFCGIAPGINYKKKTTVFYKDENCLKI